MWEKYFNEMIVQLENVTSGEILYEGEDITKLKGEKTSPK